MIAGYSSANERFNAELDLFRAGALKSNEVLHLGAPLDILKSAGIVEGEIIIKQSVLSQKLKQHNLTTEDLKGLAGAIQSPMMVYEWGTKAKSTVIITNITRNNGEKITIAVRGERSGKVLSVNDVSSVHGKAAEVFLSEMQNAKESGLSEALRYVEKEKTLDWLAMASPKGASQANQERNAITKIIQDFQNPILTEQNINEKALKNKLSQSPVKYTAFANSSEMRLTENRNGLPDIVPTQAKAVSFGKDSTFSGESQEKNAKESGLSEALRYVKKEKTLDWPAMASPKEAKQARQGRKAMIAGDSSANERFNAELDNFKEGRHKGVLHLGSPQDILKAAGLRAGEIILSADVLNRKLEEHDLSVDDLQNLAVAVQNPIMVYKWGTKAQSTVIITDLTIKDDRKITVAVRAENKGNNLEVNEVASVHGKAVERFLSEMRNAKEGGLKEALRYVEKEKALNWLGLSMPIPNQGLYSWLGLSTLSTNKRLNSITKIIQDFQNPILTEQNYLKNENVMAQNLNQILNNNSFGIIEWMLKTYNPSEISKKVLWDIVLQLRDELKDLSIICKEAKNEFYNFCKTHKITPEQEKELLENKSVGVRVRRRDGTVIDAWAKYTPGRVDESGRSKNISLYRKNPNELTTKKQYVPVAKLKADDARVAKKGRGVK